jgi:iron(III) transport system ATP-binding protein
MAVAEPALLTIDAATVRFGATAAVDGVSFAVARGEVLCLLGPSGSGKSTLLRLIAGIERPSAGRIIIDGEEVAGPRTFVEPEQRRVGMVFQDYALFPHLTVAQNVAFGVGASDAGVRELLARLGLAGLAASYPHTLSGGERQRVALARALAPQPRLLLMDEPFSSLDSRLRDEVRQHTLRFLREAAITTVFVTHDPDEALRSADRIALLDHGRLVQIGSPETLYRAPHTLFAARFFSDVTPLPGVAAGGRLQTRLGTFAAEQLPAGAAGIACLRPQHAVLSTGETGIAGRVLASQFRGDRRELLVEIDGIEAPVALRVPHEAGVRAAAVAPGAIVNLTIDAGDVPVVKANSNRS